MTDPNGRNSLSTHLRAASSSYFDITGIRLLRGRLFSSGESRFPRNPVAVVVSESLARALSLGPHDVGQRLSMADGTAVQIIGVVSDTSSVRPGERDDLMLYQSTGAANLATASVLMRFTGDPQTLISMVRTEVRALDPQLFVSTETVAMTIAQESERYAALVKLVAIPAVARCLPRARRHLWGDGIRRRATPPRNRRPLGTGGRTAGNRRSALLRVALASPGRDSSWESCCRPWATGCFSKRTWLPT